VPHLTELFVTQDSPPGNFTKLVLDLNHEPPALNAFIADAPVYQPVPFSTTATPIGPSTPTTSAPPSGLKRRPGIVYMQMDTVQAEWLVKKLPRLLLLGANDLTVDPTGDIWFTDIDYGYGYGLGLSDEAPQLQFVVYRFNSPMGETSVAEDSLAHPDGITFSRDSKTAYVGDGGLEWVDPTASRGPGDNYNYPIRIYFASNLKRNVDILRCGGYGVW